MARMMNCSPVALAHVAEMAIRRMQLVVGKAKQLQGDNRIVVSDRRRKSMQLVIALHQRFEKGDYRISSREWGVVTSVGSWLAAKHAENNNQDAKDIDWQSLPPYWQEEPLPKEAYGIACMNAATSTYG